MEKERLVILVTHAQKGNNAAMDQLFTAFYNDVYYFALKTVKDPDIACDITQETFLEIIRTIGNLNEPAAFVTWMKQIAYHQCTRYFKKQQDVLVDEDEDGNTIFDTLADEREGSVPAEVYEKEEFRQTILAMVDSLTEEQRSAVMLYYFDELSVDEVAKIQGVSTGTVKSRLNYARKALKKSVEGYEEKHGIKLHSLAPLPLLLWVLRACAQQMPNAAVNATRNALLGGSAATAVGSAAATAGSAAGSATAAAAGSAASSGTAASVFGSLGVKIIAGVVAATVAVCGTVIAVSSSKSPKRSTQKTQRPAQTFTEQTQQNDTWWQETQNSYWEESNGGVETEYWEETTEYVVETTAYVEETEPQPAREKYESKCLTPYGATAQAKDIFVEYVDYRQNRFITTEGKVRESDSMEELYWMEGKDVQSVGSMDGYATYVDSDGYTHLMIDNEEFVFQNIQGEAFWVFREMMRGVLTICSRDTDGSLYINCIETTGVKSMDNQPLTLQYLSTDTVINRVDYICMIQSTLTSYLYVEVGGDVYYCAVSIISKFDTEPQIWLSGSATLRAEDVLDIGYTGVQSPVYKKSGDSTAIYYTYGFNADELPILMPEGKSVEQLTRVVAGDTTYLFFDDGTVYAGELVKNITGTRLVLDEVLTELNQSGAIREVYRSTTAASQNCQLRLLLDDNVTYVYNLNSEE